MRNQLSKSDSQVLKGIAICAMLCHHLFLNPQDHFPTANHANMALIGDIGKICVSLFVFVSGYGMAKCFCKLNYEQNRPWKMGVRCYSLVAKRLMHFYLQYWLVFLIFVPLGIFVFHQSLAGRYGDVNLLKHLIYDFWGLQRFRSYNITWWFNMLIIILYLASPFFYGLAKKMMLPSLVLLLCFSFFTDGSFSNKSYFMNEYAISFYLGMVIALKGESIVSIISSLPKWLSCLIPVLWIMMFCMLREMNWLQLGGTRADAFISFGLAVLLMTNKLPSCLESPLAFLGKHSANIYLIHTFIFAYWFSDILFRIQSPILIFSSLLFVCVVLSMLLGWIRKMLRIDSIQLFVDRKIDHYAYSV